MITSLMSERASYLYADDVILALTRATRLQQIVYTLTELFDSLVLNINVAKIMSIECQPSCTIGGHSTEAYGLRMKG